MGWGGFCGILCGTVLASVYSTTFYTQLERSEEQLPTILINNGTHRSVRGGTKKYFGPLRRTSTDSQSKFLDFRPKAFLHVKVVSCSWKQIYTRFPVDKTNV